MAVGVGVPVAPAVIVKFVLEISKKILPTASILIRAVVVGVFGISNSSLPSFAVLARRTVGNVFPPSVDNEILTFAAFTGGDELLATFHVTVWNALPGNDTFVFGAVIANGPLLASIVTLEVAVLMPPVAG